MTVRPVGSFSKMVGSSAGAGSAEALPSTRVVFRSRFTLVEQLLLPRFIAHQNSLIPLPLTRQNALASSSLSLGPFFHFLIFKTVTYFNPLRCR